MWNTATCPRGRRDDPRTYWHAADAHERANGRLYSEIQFALPRELDASGRRALAGAFAARVCGGSGCPIRSPSTRARQRPPTSGQPPRAPDVLGARQ